jgi:hypothetical protein
MNWRMEFMLTWERLRTSGFFAEDEAVCTPPSAETGARTALDLIDLLQELESRLEQLATPREETVDPVPRVA